jgi:hypothetical protein
MNIPENYIQLATEKANNILSELHRKKCVSVEVSATNGTVIITRKDASFSFCGQFGELVKNHIEGRNYSDFESKLMALCSLSVLVSCNSSGITVLTTISGKRPKN